MAYDTELKEKAMALIAKGDSSAAEIARKLEIPQSTVANWKTQAGKTESRGPRGDQKKFERLRERAIELRGRNWTHARISEKLGVSMSSVGRWLAEAEIEAAKPAAKPWPAAKPSAPGPSPARASNGHAVTAPAVDARVVELRRLLTAVTIERDALRRALDHAVHASEHA